MLVTKEEKCRKFEDSLKDHIRAHATGFCHDDFSKIVTCALNVERVKKEKIEDRERKIPVNQVLINSKVRDSGDHSVPVSLQLRPTIERLFYRRHQLQVHKEVLLEGKMFLVVLNMGEDTRESVGD